MTRGEWRPGPGGVRRFHTLNGKPTPRQLYRRLVAERYGPAPWWESPPPSPRPPNPAPVFDDSPLVVARRRRELAEDFDRFDYEQARAPRPRRRWAWVG